jgi:hypothetical protein
MIAPEAGSSTRAAPTAITAEGSVYAARETAVCAGPPPQDHLPLPSIWKEIPRVASRWFGVVIVVSLVITGAILAIVGVRKSVEHAARVESTNHLRKIGLAFHSFHDLNKCLPYNGTSAPYVVDRAQFGGPAIPGDNRTGSWAYMILPFLKQEAIFNQMQTDAGVKEYMCPGRGRPLHCTGNGGAGAWTDYFLNSFLNHPDGAVDVRDVRRTLNGITDGSSNTILVGHGQMNPKDYSSVDAMPGFSDVIFRGGSRALCRPNTKIEFGPDSSNSVAGDWGGPFPQGALMCMGDATVRMFTYTTVGGSIVNGRAEKNWRHLAAYLTPCGGEGPFTIEFE